MHFLRWFCVCLLVFVACSERTKVTNTTPQKPVLVRGTLQAWLCGVNDGLDNIGRELRFTVATGEEAVIHVQAQDGWHTQCVTDKSSEFSFLTSAGTNTVVVETRYTWPPDTFAVEISSDTTLMLDVVYRVLDPNHVRVNFSYFFTRDTLSIQEEWRQIRLLAKQLGNPFVRLEPMPCDSCRTVLDLYRYRSVSYTLRVLSDVNVGWVADTARALIQTSGSFYEDMNVYPTGGYICRSM